MNLPVITVSELNRYVKSMFDSELMMRSILIAGEISNMSDHYRTGHIYFTLKDASSSIKAVMFSSAAARLRFEPKNGMKVTVLGRVSVFERDGVYQVYVDQMQPDGAGALAEAFEQLKKKLAAKGFFSEQHKKKIPEFPQRIGVITSPTGAAVRDIFNVTKRRYPLAEIVFCPVSVQGQNAAPEITAAIELFNEKKAADVIIVGRGGGSAEDLWAFNDEALAEAVYNSSIPIVSGVGHETDFTICDFVSDLRAPTPSAAAEIVTPDINELMRTVENFRIRLIRSADIKITAEEKRLEIILSKRSFSSPGHFFDADKEWLFKLSSGLEKSMTLKTTQCRLALSKSASALSSLDPFKVLLRGYSAVSVNGKITGSVDMIKKGDRAEIFMSDGTLTAEITEIKKAGGGENEKNEI